MAIKIKGFMFKPIESDPHCLAWRVYGTKKVFNYPDGRLAPLPQTWELVTEFKLKQARGKVGFPDFELEPTDGDSWRFYNLVPLDASGKEMWHKDDELTLPADLPMEFEPPFDVGTWLLWNMENKGIIEPGQLEGHTGVHG
jgi:hypothetical protein